MNYGERRRAVRIPSPLHSHRLSMDFGGQSKEGLIAPDRDLQSYLIILTFVQVILLQSFTNVMRGDADDGVLRRTVSIIALVHFQPDQMFIDLFRPARQMIVTNH